MPALKTRAVMVCDDDLKLRLMDVRHAFEVWQAHTDRIVGTFPRHYNTDSDGGLVYDIDPAKQYSMILTKMMIISAEYLTAYSCLMPGEILAFIDANMNCEDIAMNFLVSALHGQPPIHINHVTTDYGVEQVDGISTKNKHSATRTVCMNEFARIMRRNPLVSRSSSMDPYRGVEFRAGYHPALVYKPPSES